jgi:predicted AAA+ superfamily ATPase
MELYRSIIEDLKDWKSRPDRKPLILKGARQTGKTWIS